MAVTTQNIKIDLNTGKVLPVAYTHQNDTNRQFVFELYNNGVAYTLGSTTVKFAYVSPKVNGQYTVIAGSSMASGTVSGNTVTVTLPSAYTAVSGVGLLTMILTASSATVRPVNIRLVVQRAADGADVIAGQSDFPVTLYSYAEQILDDMTSYVTTALLADGAVTLAKLASNSVNSSKIVDGSIATGDLADGSVNTAKLADNAVTTDKINDSAVTLAKLDSTLRQDHYFALLETESYPNTTQTISFDSSGNVSQIVHKSGSTTLRTDTFTFTDTTITEVRTLSTGQKLTLATNLDTLATTATYAA